MHTRTFGRTGWQVSEIGFGAWGGADDAESMAAVQKVYDSLVRPLIHHRW
jgi:aryl-alcohol dehydrogenase-like predicted oxidoreductase